MKFVGRKGGIPDWSFFSFFPLVRRDPLSLIFLFMGYFFGDCRKNSTYIIEIKKWRGL